MAVTGCSRSWGTSSVLAPECRLTPDSPFERDVIALFGLPFDLGTVAHLADRVARDAADDRRLFLSTVNLDWLVQAGRDPAFRASAMASDVVTMDGVPVVKLAQLAGVRGAVKVAGSDLFDHLRTKPVSVFFFGGRTGAAKAAHEALIQDNGLMHAAGWHDPGFGDVASMSTPEHLAPINESGADLLVVALGAKKGQAWLMANRAALDTPIITHLGAVVDFTAGTVARAPRALQVSGFEWAWRIGQDRALWRRYADDAAALPRLVGTAVSVRRMVAALRAGAGPGHVTVTQDASGTALALSGRIDADDLRSPLHAAWKAELPLTVTLTETAAPSLGALGQIMIARQTLNDAGIRCDLCMHDEQRVKLIERTLGEASGAKPGL